MYSYPNLIPLPASEVRLCYCCLSLLESCRVHDLGFATAATGRKEVCAERGLYKTLSLKHICSSVCKAQGLDFDPKPSWHGRWEALDRLKASHTSRGLAV